MLRKRTKYVLCRTGEMTPGAACLSSGLKSFPAVCTAAGGSSASLGVSLPSREHGLLLSLCRPLVSASPGSGREPLRFARWYVLWLVEARWAPRPSACTAVLPGKTQSSSAIRAERRSWAGESVPRGDEGSPMLIAEGHVIADKVRNLWEQS